MQFAHLEHAIQIAGEDHVGLGTDGSVFPTEYRRDFAKQVAQRQRDGIGTRNEDPTAYLFAQDLNTLNRYDV